MNSLKSAIYIFLFCAVPGILTEVIAQVSIVPLVNDVEAQKHEGIYYALPKNMIRVDIWVEKVEFIRGPYSEYAGRLLGLENVQHTNSTTYHLTAAGMNVFHGVDPEKFYFVRIPEKNISNMHFSLSPEGLMQSASWEVTAKSGEKTKTGKDAEKSELRTEFVDITVPGFIEKVDTFIRRINVDTTTFEEVFFRKTFIEKSTEQKAREAANFILKLEDQRFSLITGYHEVNYSAEVMKYMNDQLLNLQNEYLTLFKGKTITTNHHYSYFYEPLPDNENQRQILCKFSPSLGILDKKSASGEPVTIEFNKAGNVAQVAGHQKMREKEKRKMTGFYYRIPDKAGFIIRNGELIVDENQFLISQLGAISFLPFDGVREIQFYPETGSVKYFRLK